MANTVISLRSSGVSLNTPSLGVLANGELSLNFADGILYYKTAANALGSIRTAGPSGLNQEIQFNDSGSFGANTTLTYNKSLGRLNTSHITANTINVSNVDSLIYGGNVATFNMLSVGANASFGNTGTIRATGDITAFFTSDKTLKENIQDIPSALDKVIAIGGKTFDWTDEYIVNHGGADGYFLNKADFGVIAQDVEEVFPIAIRTRDDGKLAVDYDKLVALAFAAIKELKSELDNK